MPEIIQQDLEELQRLRQQGSQEALDKTREVPVWEKDSAPKGSTAESLLVYENGQPVRVSGPTHHHWLADGRVVADYSVGTHYTEEGSDQVLPIVSIYG